MSATVEQMIAALAARIATIENENHSHPAMAEAIFLHRGRIAALEACEEARKSPLGEPSTEMQEQIRQAIESGRGLTKREYILPPHRGAAYADPGPGVLMDQMTDGSVRDYRTPDAACVICPNCSHQFPAISQDHQTEIAALRDTLRKRDAECDSLIRERENEVIGSRRDPADVREIDKLKANLAAEREHFKHAEAHRQQLIAELAIAKGTP